MRDGKEGEKVSARTRVPAEGSGDEVMAEGEAHVEIVLELPLNRSLSAAPQRTLALRP